VKKLFFIAFFAVAVSQSALATVSTLSNHTASGTTADEAKANLAKELEKSCIEGFHGTVLKDSLKVLGVTENKNAGKYAAPGTAPTFSADGEIYCDIPSH